MKIGIFMHNYLPRIGGAQICAHCLADGLTHLGNEVIVYAREETVRECNARNWQFSYRLQALQPPYRVIGRLQWVRLRAAATTLIDAIRHDRLDLIQLVVAWPWLPVVDAIRRKTGVPVVIRCAGDDIQTDTDVGYGIRRETAVENLLRKGFGAIDAAVAISATVTQEYIAAGVSADKIVEIPPGVDNRAFQKHDADRAAIRQRWHLPPEKRLIISVGRNHPKKGFADLVRALPHLNRHSDRFAVVVVGRETEKLVSEAERLNVSASFYPIPEISNDETIIGTFPADDLIALYKACDYFVLPSYIETYANVALEAMAAGIPCIITNAPGCIDTVQNGQDGLLVPTHAPERIAERIFEVEADAGSRERLVTCGKAKALAQDWRIISEAYLNVYEMQRDQKAPA